MKISTPSGERAELRRQKKYSAIHYIYGFKGANGKFLYVGQTENPEVRSRAGRNKYAELKEAEFVILRSAHYKDRTRLECQIITNLAKKNQCHLNTLGKSFKGKTYSVFYPK